MNWLFRKLIKTRCYRYARFAGERATRQYTQEGRLFSGADVADAPRHSIIRSIWIGLANGCEQEHLFSNAKEDWIKYCEYANEKVESAPKIRYGPSAGHSVISHRWCDPNRIDSDIIHIRNLYNSILKDYQYE